MIPALSDGWTLEDDFSGEKIENALFGMHPAKAPGPDGWSACFFQNCWKIIGDGVVDNCLNILNGGKSVAT